MAQRAAALHKGSRSDRRLPSGAILRAIQAGELDAVRLGEHGHYRVERESVEEWLRPTNEEER